MVLYFHNDSSDLNYFTDRNLGSVLAKEARGSFRRTNFIFIPRSQLSPWAVRRRL
jgi:hypothetical protein